MDVGVQVLYAREWAASLEQSHPLTEAREAAVRDHWHDVEMIESRILRCATHCTCAASSLVTQPICMHFGAYVLNSVCIWKG